LIKTIPTPKMEKPPKTQLKVMKNIENSTHQSCGRIQAKFFDTKKKFR
jgi:hypothetical protein